MKVEQIIKNNCCGKMLMHFFANCLTKFSIFIKLEKEANMKECKRIFSEAASKQEQLYVKGKGHKNSTLNNTKRSAKVRIILLVAKNRHRCQHMKVMCCKLK